MLTKKQKELERIELLAASLKKDLREISFKSYYIKKEENDEL